LIFHTKFSFLPLFSSLRVKSQSHAASAIPFG
jgi:hypothetical protein